MRPIIALIATVAIVLPAAAQETPPKKIGVELAVDAILRQFDKDADGKISKAEAMGRLADGFALIDTNKDGFLDRPELRVVAQRQLDARKDFPGGPAPAGGPDFDSLDKNADGRLTANELKGTRFAERFAEIDADSSGQIDRREFERFLKKQAKSADERQKSEK